MTILFYSQFNNRSRDTESLMMAFKTQGHRVISLSQSYGNFIHPFLEQKGIITKTKIYSNSISLFNLFRHFLYLVSFCQKHKVDVIYSHLEAASFVAVISQYFIRARVFICRHHADMFAFQDKSPGFTYWVTYKLARHIIVVSNYSKDYMVRNEGVKEDKIQVIPLAYDFALYPKPNSKIVEGLRALTKQRIVLISIGQLIGIKRPEISIYVLKTLVDRNLNVCLFLVGQGEKLEYCRALVDDLNLNDRVIFTGFVTNVMDYLACSDVLLHPSVSESSCVAVKEAGIARKPVIVCKGVGDFDEYIEHTKNGFLVNRDEFVEQACKIIIDYKDNTATLAMLGDNLNASVNRLFNIRNIAWQYEKLINKK